MGRIGAARAGLAIAIGLSLTVGACQRPPAQGEPKIVFDLVPPEDLGGSARLADVRGRVRGARPGQRIVLYARSGDWYVQPFTDAPFTAIGPDSTWANRSHLGTDYAALLVAPGFQPPAVAAALPVHQSGVLAAEVVAGTPPFWRRRSFLLVLAAAGIAAGLALHRVRVRTLARQFQLRAEERIAERTRIAQNLYDTLLQGFLGASMQLHLAVEDLPPDSPQRARFAAVLATIRQVAEEGSQVLQGLRARGEDGEALAAALLRVGREAAGSDLDFYVNVTGEVQPLHPIIREEIYCVAREALVNAFQHSRAKTVQVEIKYSSGALSIAVCDDGCGIGSREAARARGGGLRDMEARAEGIGARLRVRSRSGSGTAVELSVPGAVAYTAGPPAESE